MLLVYSSRVKHHDALARQYQKVSLQGLKVGLNGSLVVRLSV